MYESSVGSIFDKLHDLHEWCTKVSNEASVFEPEETNELKFQTLPTTKQQC